MREFESSFQFDVVGMLTSTVQSCYKYDELSRNLMPAFDQSFGKVLVRCGQVICSAQLLLN